MLLLNINMYIYFSVQCFSKNLL